MVLQQKQLLLRFKIVEFSWSHLTKYTRKIKSEFEFIY